MVQELKLFFKDYPRQILEMNGVSPVELPPGLMDQLRDYRERSLAILEDAQVFRIDIDAFAGCGQSDEFSHIDLHWAFPKWW